MKDKTMKKKTDSRTLTCHFSSLFCRYIDCIYVNYFVLMALKKSFGWSVGWLVAWRDFRISVAWELDPSHSQTV